MKIELSAEKLLYYLFCGAFFVMPMGTSPFTILGGCTLLVWIVSGEFVRKRQGYLDGGWLWPVVALVALVWLGVIWSPDPFGLGLKYAKKTHYWLYTLAVASLAFSRSPAENLIKAYLAGLLLNSLVGYLQLAHIVPRFSEWGKTGCTGFYGGYNTLAILLVLGMLIASFLFKKAVGKKEKLIYASLMVFYFLHLVILEGRGGYLTFALLSPIIVHNVLHRKKIFVVVLAYLLAIAFMLSSPIIRNRVIQTVEDFQSHLKAGGGVTGGKRYSEHIDRIYMWRWAVDLFVKHPFLGVGTGGYKQAILLEGGDKGIAHPHNNVLYMAVSFGIIGLFVFVWLFCILLRSGWQNRHGVVGFFILSSSLVILVGGLTDTHILDAGGAFLLAITTGLLSALQKEKLGEQMQRRDL